MGTALAVVMLLLIGLCVYAWLVFPLLLRLTAWRGRASGPPAAAPAAPVRHSVAVLFSAYNEERHIADRIRNLLAEAPAGHPYAIHVGVDASSDDTAVTAQRAAAGQPHVQVHAFTQRRGKVAVIKDLVRRCPADLLVFTDANTFFAAGTLDRLLAPFRDPAVGGVCGRLALVAALPAGGVPPRAQTDAGTEEGFYWRWETQLKRRESALDSCLGANGAIFAMRRELFWQELPDNTMVDDFVIGMKVREQGYRVVYEPAAVAVEELPDIQHEWVRRVRIGAGDYQALTFCRRCLSPRFGWFAWCFWSHKVLRWFTPHAVLLLALCAALALGVGHGLPQLLGALVLAGLGAFGGMALLGAFLRRVHAPAARVPLLFLHYVMMQAALFAGFLRFMSGNLSGQWTRTPRNSAAG